MFRVGIVISVLDSSTLFLQLKCDDFKAVCVRAFARVCMYVCTCVCVFSLLLKQALTCSSSLALVVSHCLVFIHNALSVFVI